MEQLDYFALFDTPIDSLMTFFMYKQRFGFFFGASTMTM